MNVIFMGTPDFASECLKSLISSSHNVMAVFSQPDKPVGRKQILTPPDVKVVALDANISVYQPTTLKDGKAAEIIKSLCPDIIVVVAYGKILPEEILGIPKYGCINVHASLLPKYRGAAPIQWAILDGEEKTGVTVMQMDKGLDTGDMLLVKETAINEDETSEELFERLSHIGASALVEALDNFENLETVRQPEGDFGYASMIDKSMCPIDWSKSSVEVHNHIRGLQTWPCATTTIADEQFKIHKSKLTQIETDKAPGTVVSSNKNLLVACGDGKCVSVLELQQNGKKRVDIKSYLAGHTIDEGTILGE